MAGHPHDSYPEKQSLYPPITECNQVAFVPELNQSNLYLVHLDEARSGRAEGASHKDAEVDFVCQDEMQGA